MVNKSNKFGAIIIIFSKVFDLLNHNVLLCKLKAYGFNKIASIFIQNYFTNKHQQTQVGDEQMTKDLNMAPCFHYCYFVFQHLN